jgi:hypothetical protein
MALKQLALLTSVFVLSQAALAQSSTSPSSQQSERDPQAVAVVQTALAQMGGVAAMGAIQSSVVSGTSVDQPEQQNASQSLTWNFTWTYAGKEFRNENNATVGSHVLVSNGGSPQDFHNTAWGATVPTISRTNLPYHVPALVLFNELANLGYSFMYLGLTTVNGANVIHVQTRDDSDLTGHQFTAQDWYFDSGTGLPSRVAFGIPVSQKPTDSVQETMDFSHFQPVNGILVPFQLNVTMAQLVFLVTVSSAVFNTNMNPSVFTPSTAGAQ